MDVMQWESPATVGVAQLDGQHRCMHGLVMELARGAGQAMDDGEAERRFTELSERVMEHFMTEEGFLEAEGYPELQAHRYEHEILFERLWDKLLRWRSPNPPALAALMEGVADLLREHIETVDSAYAAWLAGRPAR